MGFLTGICIPCYDLLYQLIPETELLVAGCRNNLARWMDMAEAGGWQEELSAVTSHGRSRPPASDTPPDSPHTQLEQEQEQEQELEQQPSDDQPRGDS